MLLSVSPLYDRNTVTGITEFSVIQDSVGIPPGNPTLGKRTVCSPIFSTALSLIIAICKGEVGKTYCIGGGNQKTNIPTAPGGGGGTVRVFFRAGTN